MTDINILEGEEQPVACEKKAFQRAEVCVPVTVKPFAHAGPTKTKCCGDPVISKDPCGGVKNGVCTFSITQEVCVEVPVKFGATADAVDVYVDCGEPSDDDCRGCV